MSEQQTPEEKPIAEVGPIVLPMKVSLALSRAPSAEREELAGTHLDRALNQGVEATFWDAVAALATDEKQRRWNVRSLPQSLSMLRHESTRGPQTAEKRRQHIDRTFRLLSQDTRALLELCMASVQARDGLTLRVLPADVVQDHSTEERELFLAQELTFKDKGIEILPTTGHDGISISARQNQSLFHQRYWFQIPVLLKRVQQIFEDHRLIHTEQLKEMTGQVFSLHENVFSMHTTWKNAPQEDPKPGLLKRALYACRLQTPPIPQATKDSVAARMRATVQERATAWVHALNQGFRRDRFTRIMR